MEFIIFFVYERILASFGLVKLSEFKVIRLQREPVVYFT